MVWKKILEILSILSFSAQILFQTCLLTNLVWMTRTAENHWILGKLHWFWAKLLSSIESRYSELCSIAWFIKNCTIFSKFHNSLVIALTTNHQIKPLPNIQFQCVSPNFLHLLQLNYYFYMFHKRQEEDKKAIFIFILFFPSSENCLSEEIFSLSIFFFIFCPIYDG